MLVAIKKYLSKEVNILGSLKPRFIWIIYGIIAIFSVSIISTFIAKLISYFHIELINLLSYGITGFACIIISFYLFKVLLENRLRGYILITLFLLGISFLVEKYFLNNEIFSPFTLRTTILLWLTLITLFASLFYPYFSKWIVFFFPPILLIGFLISFCFTLILIPYMLIGWIGILFMGLGILVYTPLMVSISFLIMFYRTVLELRDNRYYLQYTFSKYLSYAILLLTSIYFIWFHGEWNRGQSIIRNHFLENKIINSKRSLIDDDLPAWASLGMKLPANHVSELYLQPEAKDNGILFKLFYSDKLFDPFAFIVSNISKKVDILNEDREQLLKLLFGYTQISLERQWYGNFETTTDVETEIHFYPKKRLAYTEIKLTALREANADSPTITYTFKLPVGSVCTKLSIWKDGKEQLANLFHLTKTKKESVFDSTKKISASVFWKEDNFLEVKIMPLQKEKTLTFSIGIASPLKLLNSKLIYNGLKLEGPLFDLANHRIISFVYEPVDTNLSGKSYTFEKKISRDTKNIFSKWFAYGKYKEDWSVNLDYPYSSNDYTEEISELEFTEIEFHPDKIYILINSSLSKQKWKSVYTQLTSLGISSQIILVTNEWFYSKNIQENLDFIDSQVLPKFNLFPFYKIINDTDILIITNREESSIPFNELKGSIFFTKNIDFFSKNKKNIYVSSMNGKLSTYFNSLNEYELIQDISAPIDEISTALKNSKLRTIIQSEDKFSFLESGFTIQPQKIINKKKDIELFTKLVVYKKIMHSLGKKMMTTKDINNNYLFELADLANIVTPITSFAILENNNDYPQMKNNFSQLSNEGMHRGFKNSVLASLKKEFIPDPKFWIIGIICFIFFLFWSNSKLRRN